jgi:hypothetical protein
MRRNYIVLGCLVCSAGSVDGSTVRSKLVSVSTTWRVLRLRMEKRPQIWRVAANIWISSSAQSTRGAPQAWDVGEVLTTPHRKNWPCYKTNTIASGLDWYFGTTKAVQRDMRFGTLNVRSLYRSGSRTAVTGEFMDVREVGWGVWTGLMWLRIGTVGGHL